MFGEINTTTDVQVGELMMGVKSTKVINRLQLEMMVGFRLKPTPPNLIFLHAQWIQ